MENFDIVFKKASDYKNIPSFTIEEIDNKYKVGEKRLVTEQGRYPLDSLQDILEKSIKLDPEYQRSFIWNNEQKSKLMESFIMNIPVPPVFLYEVEFARYEVMDGRQRLSTIRDFYNDVFELVGLEVWSELNGMKYSQLPVNIKLGIDRRYVSTIVILNETAKNEAEEFELKQYVFERLNTGGTKLTDQEIRNAILRGGMNDFCKKISLENELFHEIFNIEKNIPFFDETNNFEEKFVRMEDVELVLRFFAYRQLEQNPKNSVKDILDLYLKEANVQIVDKRQFIEMENIFYSTLRLGKEIFGENLYKLYTYKKNGEKYSWNKVPTKLLYDPINIILSEFIVKNCQVKMKKDINFQKKLENLFKEHSAIFNGRNNSKTDVISRVNLLRSFFEETLEVD